MSKTEFLLYRLMGKIERPDWRGKLVRLNGAAEIEGEKVGQRLTSSQSRQKNHCSGKTELLLNETKGRKRKGKVRVWAGVGLS